jgi:probable HAF family extracellular repeat protein
MVDLNDLIARDSGWLLLEATQINNRGEVVGTGSINGENHAFLLTPENDFVQRQLECRSAALPQGEQT